MKNNCKKFILIKTPWILTITLIIGAFGCAVDQNSDNENLIAYLDQVHSRPLENALYIVIPINSCDGCRQIVYRNLLTTSHSKDIKIIFSGKVREALTNQYLKRLEIMGVDLMMDDDDGAGEFGLLEEEYPMSYISFIDVVDNRVISKSILKPYMINGEVDIRKEMFKNYLLIGKHAS